jgi:hypothetical protein
MINRTAADKRQTPPHRRFSNPKPAIAGALGIPRTGELTRAKERRSGVRRSPSEGSFVALALDFILIESVVTPSAYRAPAEVNADSA